MNEDGEENYRGYFFEVLHIIISSRLDGERTSRERSSSLVEREWCYLFWRLLIQVVDNINGIGIITMAAASTMNCIGGGGSGAPTS